MSDEERRDWFFTFGLGDAQHSKCYVRIHGTKMEARLKMVELFDRRWAFQYSEDEKPRAIDRFGLTELPIATRFVS